MYEHILLLMVFSFWTEGMGICIVLRTQFGEKKPSSKNKNFRYRNHKFGQFSKRKGPAITQLFWCCLVLLLSRSSSKSCKQNTVCHLP